MPAKPFSSSELKALAAGSLRCSRARWSERDANCTVQTPCPVHAEVYRALIQAAQDRAILEGLHPPTPKDQRVAVSSSRRDGYGHKEES